jgi:hypothetical protein
VVPLDIKGCKASSKYWMSHMYSISYVTLLAGGKLCLTSDWIIILHWERARWWIYSLTRRMLCEGSTMKCSSFSFLPHQISFSAFHSLGTAMPSGYRKILQCVMVFMLWHQKVGSGLYAAISLYPLLPRTFWSCHVLCIIYIHIISLKSVARNCVNIQCYRFWNKILNTKEQWK